MEMGGDKGLLEERRVVWMKDLKRDASKCSHDLTTMASWSSTGNRRLLS